MLGTGSSGPPKERPCTIAVIERDGRVLMGRKAPGVGIYPNKWLLPGGGLLPHETNFEGLKREVFEETGLEVVSAKPILYQEDIVTRDGQVVKCQFFTYLAEAKGEPGPSEELVELRWFSKAEFQEADIPPVTAEVFKHLGWL